MSLLWSGPSRALQAHLDLFGNVEAAVTGMRRARDDAERNGRYEVSTAEFPLAFHQRARLMSSLDDTVKVKTAGRVDGQSISLGKDNNRDSYESASRAVSLLNQEYKILNEGETHYISERIMNMLTAMSDVAEPDRLYATDVPCPKGLIVLEYPLMMPDLHPETGDVYPELLMPIRAIGWTADIEIGVKDGDEFTPQPGITYVLYCDAEAYKKIYISTYEDCIGPYPVEEFDESPMLKMWATDVSGWAYNTDWLDAGPKRDDSEIGTGFVHATVASVRKFIHAYFRFTWQRIVVTRTHHMNRAEKRQMVRSGRKETDEHIKVVYLRRDFDTASKPSEQPGDQLRHDHQWIVRGHTRRQWYPKLGPAKNPDGSFNHDSHRVIWIEPFIQGNPFGPLVVGHNITASVR